MSPIPWQDSPAKEPAEGKPAPLPRLVLIGPCASGKSVVSAALRARGIDARSVAQEHTVIPDLWRHARPDILVYLDVSSEVVRRRRAVSWGPQRLAAQKEALGPARRVAALVIDTDDLSVDEVVSLILEHLHDHLT